MKKSFLSTLKPLLVTPLFVKTAMEDLPKTKRIYRSWGTDTYINQYKHYRYLRAEVEQDILKIAMFQRAHIVAGINEPIFTIFLSKKENEFITKDVNGNWSQAKIDMLNFEKEDGEIYELKYFCSETDKKKVQAYLECEGEPSAAVLEFQWNIRKEELSRKHRRETDQIDEVMNEVPELPKDFATWTEEYGMWNSRYLFYEAGKKKQPGYCSHCNQEVVVTGAKRNENGICPSCRSHVIFKPNRGQTRFGDSINVAIIQPMNDKSGYVARFFSAHKEWYQKDWKTPEFRMREYRREIMNNAFVYQECYEFFEYKHTGIDRWCKGERPSQAYYYYGRDYRAAIYTRNLKRIRKQVPDLKYIPIEDLLTAMRGQTWNVQEFMYETSHRPIIEFFIKTKMFKLSKDIITRHVVPKARVKKPWEALDVTKEQLGICRTLDGGAKMIDIFIKANKEGVKVNEVEADWIDKNIDQDIVKFAKGTTIHKVIRYFKEVLFPLDEKHAFRDYWDYIAMAEKNGYDTMLESIRFPKDFKFAHDQMVEEQKIRQDKEKKKKEQQLNRLYKKKYLEIKELYSYEDKDFVIVIPTCKDDFRKEGNQNCNCVGGYFEKVTEGRSVVVFLRKKSDPEKSYCTVEMNGSKTLQCRARGNAGKPKAADKFMKKYEKHLQKKLEKMMEVAS